MPPTQQMPPTQAYPGGPPGGYPPQGYAPVGQPPEPPKKTGLIVVGGIAAIAAVVGGVLLFTGGDDDKSTAPGDSTISITLPVAEDTTVVTVAPVTTLAPEETFVITAPPPTDPPPATTVPDTSGVVEVADDLGKFTVVLPDDLEIDTTPINTQDGFTVPSVTGADSLDGFYNDDVTFGISLLAVGPEAGSSVESVLAFLEPDEGVCTGSQLNIGYPTAIGTGTMEKLDGCSPDGSAAKVLIVVAIPERNVIVAVYAQSLGTAESLLPFTQAVFETIRAV
jgi:hypothetical protein